MRGRINTPDTLIKFSELDNVLTLAIVQGLNTTESDKVLRFGELARLFHHD